MDEAGEAAAEAVALVEALVEVRNTNMKFDCNLHLVMGVWFTLLLFGCVFSLLEMLV